MILPYSVQNFKTIRPLRWKINISTILEDISIYLSLRWVSRWGSPILQHRTDFLIIIAYVTFSCFYALFGVNKMIENRSVMFYRFPCDTSQCHHHRTYGVQWRHGMDTLCTLLARTTDSLCMESADPSSDIFRTLSLHKLLNKHSSCRWFETPWWSCNVIITLTETVLHQTWWTTVTHTHPHAHT